MRRSFRAVCRAAGIGPDWTPRELRHTFVSLMSDSDVAVEEIARLVGHASSKVTETVYRHQLRPVLTTGAEKMDALLTGIERSGTWRSGDYSLEHGAGRGRAQRGPAPAVVGGVCRTLP